jgi:hypothetical protein
MVRAYAIPSTMEPEQALDRVVDLFSPWGYQWVEIDRAANSILVSASALVIKVIEPAVRFELHETKGCTCKPCKNLAEVMA